MNANGIYGILVDTFFVKSKPIFQKPPGKHHAQTEGTLTNKTIQRQTWTAYSGDIRYVKVKLENIQCYINLGMDYSSRLTASLSMEHFESKPPSLVQAKHHLILQFLLTPVRLKDSSIIFAQTLKLPELQEERNIPHREL